MTQKSPSEHIVLASASPRRKEILAGMGACFCVVSADVDESCDLTDPIELTRELARRKGEATLNALAAKGEDEGAIIISADTVVACDGRILGKPQNEDEAYEMLSLISGRAHTVCTGIAITYHGTTHVDHSVTTVHVDNIPHEEIKKYIDSGDPFDKAGSYGIQGRFSQWVRGIDGCYFGVVGLPVNKLSSLFKKVVGRYPDEI
ncbi:MAG: septum formation protein Maf [Ruminococcaceae bacterium]|nr:septum formation protein Maf [Oscillospiraceae bacterium]